MVPPGLAHEGIGFSVRFGWSRSKVAGAGFVFQSSSAGLAATGMG